MVNKPKSVKPQWHYEICKFRFIEETVSLLAHLCQQLDQSQLVIHFFSTAYKREVRLFANTTSQSTETASMIVRFTNPGTALSQRSRRRSRPFSSFPSVLIRRSVQRQSVLGTVWDTRTRRTAVVSNQERHNDTSDPAFYSNVPTHPVTLLEAIDSSTNLELENIQNTSRLRLV